MKNNNIRNNVKSKDKVSEIVRIHINDKKKNANKS